MTRQAGYEKGCTGYDDPEPHPPREVAARASWLVGEILIEDSGYPWSNYKCIRLTYAEARQIRDQLSAFLDRADHSPDRTDQGSEGAKD